MNKRVFHFMLFGLLHFGLGSCVSTVPVGTSASVYVGPRPNYRPYYRPYSYNRPPVVVRPRYYDRSPGPRYYRSPRGNGYGRGGRR